MSENKQQIPYEELSNHDLLVKLAKQGRHRRTLLIILVILVLIASLATVYAVITIVPMVTDSMKTISEMAVQCEEALVKIDQIDIETMNSAIEDFSKVARTLASFFGK